MKTQNKMKTEFKELNQDEIYLLRIWVGILSVMCNDNSFYMTKLKTLEEEERLINYNVFRYLWLVNMLQLIREDVLFVIKNINLQMVEVKLVQENVGIKEKENIIRNIRNYNQKFQEMLLKNGKEIIVKELMKRQDRDGKTIRNYKLETNQMDLLRNLRFQNMENANFVENYQKDKFIILNIQRRALF